VPNGTPGNRVRLDAEMGGFAPNLAGRMQAAIVGQAFPPVKPFAYRLVTSYRRVDRQKRLLHKLVVLRPRRANGGVTRYA
jgi:hypothetical protein